MYQLIGLVRIFALALLTILGLVAGIFSGTLSTSAYLKLAAIWHFCVTAIVGVDCRFNTDKYQTGSLVVCNHISWLDISVIGRKFPVVFLAGSEIANWPVLGWIIRKTGTLFIERGKGSKAAVKEIANSLGQNQSVLIFPEGKTTNGSEVIRFQPRLFQSAIDSGAKIQPIAIRYLDKFGKRLDRMSYKGNVGFLGSLWRTLCGPRIVADVHVFAPITVVSNRNTLSQDAEHCIRQRVESTIEP